VCAKLPVEIRFAIGIFAAHSFSVMSDRQIILEAVQEMPETASLREIVDELLLLDEVKRRLAKSERGERGVPHEEAAKMLDSWITK
jgi:predicted transcriptional regulator